MFGPPEDEEGKCNAHLYIADDHGDNTATMTCQLEPNHDGLHKEQYDDSGVVIVQWEHDQDLYT